MTCKCEKCGCDCHCAQNSEVFVQTCNDCGCLGCEHEKTEEAE